MKNLLYFIIFSLPAFAYTQQPWHISSPFDYIWMNVGNAGFSEGNATNISLAFDTDGEPYVAYSDDYHSDKTSVMKFNGSNWEYLGNA